MTKVLIANRGEIAVRIIRACHDLGYRTVAVYSDVEQEALHVLHADEAVCIGKGAAHSSYLKIAHILSACEITGADAIHPGYGFLSENANFASVCLSCGLNFIGPKPETMHLLADKARAKEVAQRAGCPTIPGTGVIEDPQEAFRQAKKLGFPVVIKASAGGGGKGIRLVDKEEDFIKNFLSARAEAEANFGNPDVFVEKRILNPRHIEVQILADTFQNCIHLGERDCTIQRRRQKLIEEAPSPVLDPKTRERIAQSALAIAREANYSSAGTVEFLLDKKGNFYFMEVNTRIQVEHTVTEEVTGIDLVKEQIELALGKKLGYKQEDVTFSGHAVQFRINAEDPHAHFAPSPGKVEYYVPPGGPHVRVDSACYSGCTISPIYDSMMAKLIVKGKTREEALAASKRALREFHVGGVKTTIPFHSYIIHHKDFEDGEYDISYIDTLLDKGHTFTK